MRFWLGVSSDLQCSRWTLEQGCTKKLNAILTQVQVTAVQPGETEGFNLSSCT
jgi:hypothetical protein